MSEEPKGPKEETSGPLTAPPAGRDGRWAKGALVRGFYAAVQAYDAANLALLHMFPRTSRFFGLERATGGTAALCARIAKWESAIERHNVEPLKPGYLKSGFSFLLYNTTYLLPVIATGLTAGFLGGPVAALVTAGVLNTHAMMGEAFVAAARKTELTLTDPGSLAPSLHQPDFHRSMKRSALIRGGICLAFTLAAGPLARLMGGFTAGALNSLARTPLGGLLSDQFLHATHQSAVKSMHKPVGKLLTEIFDKGPAQAFARLTVTVAFVRAATAGAAKWIRGEKAKPESGEPESLPEEKSNELPPEQLRL